MTRATKRPTTPVAIGRERAAIDIIAGDENPQSLDLIRLCWATGVGFLRLEYLIRCERLRRGDITIADLTPPQRREMVDVEALDLHALANGPIMQPDQLYLPAGRISHADARAREASLIIQEPTA